MVSNINLTKIHPTNPLQSFQSHSKSFAPFKMTEKKPAMFLRKKNFLLVNILWSSFYFHPYTIQSIQIYQIFSNTPRHMLHSMCTYVSKLMQIQTTRKMFWKIEVREQNRPSITFTVIFLYKNMKRWCIHNTNENTNFIFMFLCLHWLGKWYEKYEKKTSGSREKNIFLWS